MVSSSFDRSYDYMFKVLLVGDSGVGKTSVVKQFSSGTFEEKFDSTIGVDFTIKTLEIDGKLIKLQIWDTAGQERFRTITQSFYRGAYGIIMVYDISNYSTFDSAPIWLDGMQRYASIPDMVRILVGNKCDLEQLREVDASEARSYADSHDFFSAVEISAKTNTNVNDLFVEMAKEMKRKFVDDSILEKDPPDGLLLKGKSVPDGRSSCCGGASSER